MIYSKDKRNNDVDEFLTPAGLVTRVMQMLSRHENFNEPFTVLDPGANLGQWGTAVKEKYQQAVITGVEIMDLPKPDAYDEWYNADFLTWKAPQKYDLIIGNPPYSMRINEKKIEVAESFIRRSISFLKPTGWVYFVLRSGIRYSRQRTWQDRRIRTIPGLHQQLHYFEAWALSPRPSFYKEDAREEEYGTTKTNAHDYDLFTWTPRWQMPYGFSLELDWEYEDNENLCAICESHWKYLQAVALGNGRSTGSPYAAARS